MNKKFVIIMLILALILGISFFVDKPIVLGIQSLRNANIDNAISALSFAKSDLVFAIFIICLVLVLFLRKKGKKEFARSFFSLGITLAVVYALKAAISRVRPSEVFNIAQYSDNFGSSFPSMHSAIIFSLLPFIWKKYPTFRYVYLLYALLIAFSRIWFGAHYLSDVIAGIMIGLLIGQSILKIDFKKKKK